MGSFIKWHFTDLVGALIKRVENNFDNVIAITGNRGIGKSDLAVNVGRRMPPFKMSKQITFTREQLMKCMNDMKKSYISGDEMINVAHNREFFSQQQINLIKMINMYRDNNNTLVFCIKNFWVLDTQLRDLVTMRIHIERRGLGIIHIPHSIAFCRDKWDSVTNEKIERMWLSRKVYKPNYSRLTTCRGYLRFDPLPKKVRERYDSIKNRKRNIIYTEKIAEAPVQKLSLLEIYKAPSEMKLDLLKKYAEENNQEITSVARKVRELSHLVKMGNEKSRSGILTESSDKTIKSPLPLLSTKES